MNNKYIPQFRRFLTEWNVMMPKPIGNTVTLHEIDKNILDEILDELKNFVTEVDDCYIIKYCGNTINIKK